MWEGLQAGKKARERLREIGGVGGALAGKAQQLYDLLPEGEKSLLRRALVRLVQLGEGTRDTRRRMAIPDLCGHGDAEEDVLSILRGHAGPVRGACFSPDGRRLLSVSLDSVVCIWDVDAETRSSDEVALLIDYASSYRCEGEVIVPITRQTSSGAPLLRLLPKRLPQQRYGRRLHSWNYPVIRIKPSHYTNRRRLGCAPSTAGRRAWRPPSSLSRTSPMSRSGNRRRLCGRLTRRLPWRPII